MMRAASSNNVHAHLGALLSGEYPAPVARVEHGIRRRALWLPVEQVDHRCDGAELERLDA